MSSAEKTSSGSFPALYLFVVLATVLSPTVVLTLALGSGSAFVVGFRLYRVAGRFDQVPLDKVVPVDGSFLCRSALHGGDIELLLCIGVGQLGQLGSTRVELLLL
jgi:hypothetical protein